MLLAVELVVRVVSWRSWWHSLGGGLEEEDEEKHKDQKAATRHGGWVCFKIRGRVFSSLLVASER